MKFHYYISKLVVDVLKAQISLALMKDPDQGKINGEVTFFDIQNVDVQYIDPVDENCLSSLLGVQVEAISTGTKFILNTDLVEVTFVCAEMPRQNWLDHSDTIFDGCPN